MSRRRFSAAHRMGYLGIRRLALRAGNKSRRLVRAPELYNGAAMGHCKRIPHMAINTRPA